MPTSRRSGSPTRRGGCSASPGRPSSTSRSTTRWSATSCCRTSSAGRSRWCAARPAGRRTASSSAMPSPACRPRSPRFETDQFARARPRPTSPSRTPRAIWRWRSSASSSSTPGARLRKQLDKPDRIVFDLDPGEGIAWREVVEAAVHIEGELEALGLVPFVKTSGGKGIHVVVPLEPKLDWKQVHRGDRARSPTRIAADRARHLHHHHGQGQPQAGASSSTSTATRAAPPRRRPIRCAPAPTCRRRRR